MTRLFQVSTALMVAAVVAFSCSKPTTASRFPVAVDDSKVGEYPAFTKSGGGFFYDEVLEYRVWVHRAGGDRFYAFATFEEAEDYARGRAGAEAPLVLVLQHEHVDEPEPGKYVHVKGDRITEWSVEWLADSKRTPTTIGEFLTKHRK